MSSKCPLKSRKYRCILFPEFLKISPSRPKHEKRLVYALNFLGLRGLSSPGHVSQKIEWFKLTDLPTWKRNKAAPGKFYLISPFIGYILSFSSHFHPHTSFKCFENFH